MSGNKEKSGNKTNNIYRNVIAAYLIAGIVAVIAILWLFRWVAGSPSLEVLIALDIGLGITTLTFFAGTIIGVGISVVSTLSRIEKAVS